MSALGQSLHKLDPPTSAVPSKRTLSKPRIILFAVRWTYFFVRRGGSSEILGRCFAQKCGERCRILLAGGEILGKALVEFRGAFIKLARGRIVADKAGDLLHF